MHLGARLLDTLDVPALDLQSYGRFYAGELHIQTVLHGHSPGIRQTWKLQLLVHLANQFFVGHACTPLFARFEHDRGVVHIERSIVGGASRAPHRAKDALHFRKRLYDAVLLLQQRGSLVDGNAR